MPDPGCFDFNDHAEIAAERAGSKSALNTLLEVPKSAAESFIFSFKQVQQIVHENARQKGWWKDDNTSEDGVRIALMHSELSEALEAMRNGNPYSKKIPNFEHVTEEMADVVIRIMDYCERRELCLAEAIIAKHHHNIGRPFKHGGKAF